MKSLFTYWHADISSLIVIGLLLIFSVATKSYRTKTATAINLILIIVCLFSPLSVLSSGYLFSAHMTVHVILLLFVGPVMLLSLPVEQFKTFFLFLKNHPLISWLTGVSVMWLWHIPFIFNSEMSSMMNGSFTITTIIEPLTLIFAGVLFSSPIIHPNKKYRIDALPAIIYLVTACVGCSILGLLITFAPAEMFHHFLSMSDSYRLNDVIEKQWGFTRSIDQQIAGLIMWVPCCIIYVSVAMFILAGWFKEKREVIA